MEQADQHSYFEDLNSVLHSAMSLGKLLTYPRTQPCSLIAFTFLHDRNTPTASSPMTHMQSSQ